jgi:hypothetical protein
MTRYPSNTIIGAASQFRNRADLAKNSDKKDMLAVVSKKLFPTSRCCARSEACQRSGERTQGRKDSHHDLTEPPNHMHAEAPAWRRLMNGWRWTLEYPRWASARYGMVIFSPFCGLPETISRDANPHTVVHASLPATLRTPPVHRRRGPAAHRRRDRTRGGSSEYPRATHRHLNDRAA